MPINTLTQFQRSWRNWGFAATLTILLASCASPSFQADVTRFHQNYVPQTEFVSIQPSDPGLGQSLEFSAYANQLGERLGKIGFKPATAGALPTLIAEFGYTQSTVSGLQANKRSPINIGIGVGGGEGNFGLGGSVNFPVGGNRQYENLTKVLTVTLHLKKSGANAATVWEGRATSQGPSGSSDYALSTAVPNLLDALLANFPGESGKTVRYTSTSAKK